MSTLLEDSTNIDRFKSAMRQMASAVCIISTQFKGQRAGLTATSVCSLSIDPPSLLVCINRESDSHPLITGRAGFCVNILQDKHKTIADCFAGGTGLEGDDRFQIGDWQYWKSGIPFLSDAMASLECRLSEEVFFRSHSIFIGEVIEVIIHPKADEARPLLYWRRNYHHLGPENQIPSPPIKK